MGCGSLSGMEVRFIALGGKLNDMDWMVRFGAASVLILLSGLLLNPEVKTRHAGCSKSMNFRRSSGRSYCERYESFCGY